MERYSNYTDFKGEDGNKTAEVGMWQIMTGRIGSAVLS